MRTVSFFLQFMVVVLVGIIIVVVVVVVPCFVVIPDDIEIRRKLCIDPNAVAGSRLAASGPTKFVVLGLEFIVIVLAVIVDDEILHFFDRPTHKTVCSGWGPLPVQLLVETRRLRVPSLALGVPSAVEQGRGQAESCLGQVQQGRLVGNVGEIVRSDALVSLDRSPVGTNGEIGLPNGHVHWRDRRVHLRLVVIVPEKETCATPELQILLVLVQLLHVRIDEFLVLPHPQLVAHEGVKTSG
mmetsp:Transcript_5749/g.12135  ORF Transcript_5749/g.12135 Transcript_5749/m.12135 type:complete len:241 (-) Transcript_5749:1530-2252(-)